MGFGAPELLIVLAVVVMLFGGSQIPKLARGLGRAQKEYKDASENPEPEDEPKKDKSGS